MRGMLGTLSICVAMLLAPHAARAAGSPEEQCQKGRHYAAAKYAQCEWKAMGTLYSKGDFVRFQEASSSCRVKYTGAWAKLQTKASGTGSQCDVARFVVNAGTVTDNLTGLQWEQKTDDAGTHDKDNTYSWTAIANAADGTAFTGLLATLNSGSCFAGHCDWRLPTYAELQTILAEPQPCTSSPCIDEGIFGPTGEGVYWSSTRLAGSPSDAWGVSFSLGDASYNLKTTPLFVRAVRGGF